MNKELRHIVVDCSAMHPDRPDSTPVRPVVYSPFRLASPPPNDDQTSAELRSTVTTEATLLGFVAVVNTRLLAGAF